MIALVAAAFQAVLLLFRQVAVIILAGTLPLAAAGTMTPLTRPWFRKVTGWELALIFYKAAAATVYAAGFLLVGQGTSGAGRAGRLRGAGPVHSRPAGPAAVLQLGARPAGDRRRRRRARLGDRRRGRGRRAARLRRRRVSRRPGPGHEHVRRAAGRQRRRRLDPRRADLPAARAAAHPQAAGHPAAGHRPAAGGTGAGPAAAAAAPGGRAGAPRPGPRGRRDGDAAGAGAAARPGPRRRPGRQHPGRRPRARARAR